jgi:hypothetical protein
MASGDQLTTTQNGGAQSNTGSPQTTAKPSTGAQTTDFQPTAGGQSLNTSNGAAGIPLSGTTSKKTANDTTIASTSTTSNIGAIHHVNPVLLTVPALFLLIAVASMVFMKRSAKSTTY